MTQLVKTKTEQITSNNGNRLEKLASLKSLVPKSASQEDKVLLLDVSGSMAFRLVNSLNRRIDALRTEVAGFLGKMPTFEFSSSIEEVPITKPEDISEPYGGTNLAEALNYLGEMLYTHVIIVTDGEPNNEYDALDMARKYSLVCDVIYIGDPPPPDFIARLANATGGSSCRVEMGRKELTTTILGLLPAPKEVIKL